ncbi:unnamed protein product [Polarella glacialis]|uniref:Uncharacterized protein n=1 Tax=Polarella glacialis TaxID=89957 RepID=A0A813I0P7_POLGL|nr:unnamed protein product [Polarella glacialis]
MSAASLQDALRGFLGKAEHNGSRWFLVAIGVVILLRLRLILFAAALPVMAYWHYSNQQQEAAAKEEAPGDDGDEADQAEEYPPRAGHRDDYDDDRPEPGRRPSVPKEEEEGDPYDDAFWSQDKQDAGEPRRTAPWRSAETSSSTAARPSTDFKKNLRPDDHLDLGFDDLDSALDSRKPDLGFSWDGGRDELDDLLGGGDLGGSRSRPSTGLGNNRSGTDSMLDELAGLGSRGRGGMDDFDFLGGGGGGDMDFFSGGFGGGGKGKGKGKSKASQQMQQVRAGNSEPAKRAAPKKTRPACDCTSAVKGPTSDKGGEDVIDVPLQRAQSAAKAALKLLDKHGIPGRLLRDKATTSPQHRGVH